MSHKCTCTTRILINKYVYYVSEGSRGTHAVSISHEGALQPEDEYDVAARIALSNRISGHFWAHVITDANNDVYEHTNEGDNTDVSDVSYGFWLYSIS